MKLTNLEIYNLVEGIQNLKDEDLPVKTEFILLKNLKELMPYYDSIIECRDQYIRAAGASQADEGQLEIPEDRRPHLQKQIKELCDIENSLTLSTVSINDLSQSNISMETLDKIYPIISEG